MAKTYRRNQERDSNVFEYNKRKITNKRVKEVTFVVNGIEYNFI